MKLHALRTASALALAAILAACGGGQTSQMDQPAMTAVAFQSSSAARVSAANAAMPAPDCAADGCKGLRIIDGNAEAARYDAMRRAATEEAAGAVTGTINS
jgi:hypothetical protein